MTSSFRRSLQMGCLAAVFFFNVQAHAADATMGKVISSLENKNLTEVQNLLRSEPKSVDTVIKALLKHTQTRMVTDPDFSNKMMLLAGSYANQISPPSVPAVCADLRRIADNLTPEQAGTPLFTAVMSATESFAKAPVVVSAGRPNECEQAFLQMQNLDEEALLAQTPGMRGPGLPAVTVKPGLPPTDPVFPPTHPSEPEKPSAD
ncbi:MAG: hypothetical protein AB7E52_01865 [Bdellovibrionales bacterium]